MYVEDVEDLKQAITGYIKVSRRCRIDQIYIVMHNVEDVEHIKTSHNRCILKYVEDVEDRSNIHKGCNAVCRRRRRLTYHILAHNFLNT